MELNREQLEITAKEQAFWIDVKEKAVDIGTVVALGAGVLAGVGIALARKGHPVLGPVTSAVALPLAWRAAKASQEMAVESDNIKRKLWNVKRQLSELLAEPEA